MTLNLIGLLSFVPRAEFNEVNEECLQRLDGNPVNYEAIDSNHNGHPLREVDNRRLQCTAKTGYLTVSFLR